MRHVSDLAQSHVFKLRFSERVHDYIENIISSNDPWASNPWIFQETLHGGRSDRREECSKATVSRDAGTNMVWKDASCFWTQAFELEYI